MEAPVQGRKGRTNGLSHLKRPIAFVPLISFSLVIVVLLAYFSPLNFMRNAHAAGITALPGIRTHLAQSSRIGAQTDPNTRITIAIGLHPHNADGLAQYVKDVSKAQGKQERSLTTDQLLQAYSPYPAEQQAVIDYMQSNGFQTTQTFKHRLVVGFSGTIGQAEQAFHVTINNYTDKSGRTFYAPAGDPLVPVSIAPYITTIEGLDNTARYTHGPVNTKVGSTSTKTATSQSAQGLVSNAVTCLANGTPSATPTYYTPSQIKSAYNMTNLQNGYKGDGQHVAVVEFSDYKDSDVKAYANCYGAGATPVSRVKGDGVGNTLNDGTPEAELDIELILSTAPRLAGLHVYEAQNSSDGNLLMWGQIVADAVPVVSTSWGMCETDLTPSEAQTENSLFSIAAAQGQSIFASSGDSGSAGDCADGLPHVDDPSSQPNVTGVGGTTLHITSTNTYSGETVWNTNSGASGGGISTLWAMPDWQLTTLPSTAKYTPYAGQSCGSASGYCRQVPDVALDADWNTGYITYLSNCDNTGACQTPNWYYTGGTSASTPMFAAYTALANQKSLSQGYFNLGMVNPLLYGVAHNSTKYSADFHDIVSGSNTVAGMPAGYYNATAGYDLATGLGTPKSDALFNDLVGMANSQTGARKVASATKWYFAEGSVGNGFQEFISILNPSTTQAASVNVTYLFPNGRASKTVNHQVAASTRGTVALMSDLNLPDTGSSYTSVSAIVQSVPNANNMTVPIVAERPMYFNFANRIYSGTNVIGANDATQTNFYFAIGDTRQSTDGKQQYNTFITMLNPSTTTTATVTATYYANGQVVNTDTVNVGPMQRGTLNPANKNVHQQVSMKITSTSGIVVERPMYFQDTVATAGGAVSGATTAVAASNLSKDWVFAEGNTGSTGSKFQENLVLANFTAADTTAQVNLTYDNGQVQTLSIPVAAYSQAPIDVNAYRAQFAGTSTDGVSIKVHDDNGAIVAERFSYFSYNRVLANGTTKVIVGGTDAVGEPNAIGHTGYTFAEGYTAEPSYENLVLFNPDASNTVHVAVTVYAHNTVVQKMVELKPLKRTTININDIVVPMAIAYPLPSGAYNVSMSVQGLDGRVVAERTSYFVSDNIKHGGSSMFGYTNDLFQ